MDSCSLQSRYVPLRPKTFDTFPRIHHSFLVAPSSHAALRVIGITMAVFGSVWRDLTCHNGGGPVSCKRGRDLPPVPTSALLPIPTMAKAVVLAPLETAVISRLVDSALTSTRGRTAARPPRQPLFRRSSLPSSTDCAAPVQRRDGGGAENAVPCPGAHGGVRRGVCGRRWNWRQRVDATLRQTSTESLAWLNLARSNDAVAAGLRATLDHLLRSASVPTQAEGFGDNDPITTAVADNAQSC